MIAAKAAAAFYKPKNVALEFSNLDNSVELAIQFKRIDKPLMDAQIKELVQWLF